MIGPSHMRNCSMLCFHETWLSQRSPNEANTPAAYTAYKDNHNTKECGKSHGGVMAVLVKQSGCMEVKVISVMFSKHGILDSKMQTVLPIQKTAMHYTECCYCKHSCRVFVTVT